MCECRSQFSDRHGFALLLTLGFLAIMGAILLTVDQYARIQSERGQREMHRAIARQNALGALKIAIGELNAIHGDGRHITARAELRREMVQPEHSQWVGVWDVVDGVAIFNRWLLSIPIPQKWDIQSPLTVFPEEIDIWKDFCPKDRCPTLPIYNGERLTGHFAYWIEDECSKARINLENPSIPLRHIVQQIPFHGLENSSKRLAGQRPFAALWDAMNGDAGAYFHGISLSSCGILRNTCGQWLIDLTTKLRHRQFSPHDYIFPADPQWAEPPPTFSFVASFFDATSHGQDTTIAPQSGGPHYLFHGFATNVYSHGMAQLPVADLGLNISTVASIHPIIVGMCISLIAEGNNQAVTLKVMPKVFLWNPYAKGLENRSYVIRIVPASAKELAPACSLETANGDISLQNIFSQWETAFSLGAGEVYAFSIQDENLYYQIPIKPPKNTAQITLRRLNNIHFSWGYMSLQLLDADGNLLQEINDFLDPDQGGDCQIVLDGTAREIFRLVSLAHTGNDGEGSTQWIAHHNLRAPQVRRNTYENAPPLGIKDHFLRKFSPWHSTFLTPLFGESLSLTAMTFFGDGSSTAILFSLPKEVYSIATLQHVPLCPFSYHPSYAVGNSLANPTIPLNSLHHHPNPPSEILRNHPYFRQCMLFDYSYLLNDALYDHYFVSGFSSSHGEPMFFTNCAPCPWKSTANVPWEDSTKSAQHLILHGAFNVNSTSLIAWKCLLQSLPYDPIGNFYYLQRFEGQGDAGGRFQRRPQMDEATLDRLAECIVEEIKNSGPFPSLGKFVNRCLEGEDPKFMEKGPLQRAIERAKINEASDRLCAPSNDLRDSHWFNEDLGNGPTNFQSPAYLTQGDLLQFLGNQFTVRSDTFFLRAYGDSVGTVGGKVRATAMCEALLQRTPSGELRILCVRFLKNKALPRFSPKEHFP